MMKRDPEAVVGAFVDAFNAENPDALVAVLSETVEVHGRRGVIRGREQVREWAGRNPSGELRQRLVLDQVLAGGESQVAVIRRQWIWADGEQVADEARLGVVVALDDDGLIRLWHPFDDPAAALAAAERGGAAGPIP